MPALVEHLIVQVLPVRLEQVILLRVPLRGLSASLALVPDDLGHVLAVVRQVDRHADRIRPPVLPGLLDDPLRNRRAELRQRRPADLVHGQPVKVFPCFCRQFHPADGDRHRGLAVPPQPPQRPRLQQFLRTLALVGLDLVDPSVYRLVLAQVVPVDVQVVLADRVDPRVHPAPAYALAQRAQVPLPAHLALHRVVPLPDVQLERVHAHVVFPNAVLQAVRDRLDGVVQAVSVELVRIAYVVGEIPQHPVTLLRQDIFNRLLCRAGCRTRRAGHHGRCHLAEEALILQDLNHVLQPDRDRLRVHAVVDALYPPDDRAFRPVILQQPVVEADLRCPVALAERDRTVAVPLRQRQRLRLRQEPRAPREAVPAQFVHLMQTSRSSSP